MKVLSIIPARGGSKGIPLKNLIKLNGKLLLDYTVSASLNSQFVTKTIVSSDSQKILNHAKNLGVEISHRSKKLSTNSAQIEPLIIKILNELKRKEKFIPDIIILLQNTSPLRTSKHIDLAFNLFLKGGYDSVLSGFKSHYFLWDLQGKFVKPISHSPSKRTNRQQMKSQFCENGAMYITKYSSFQKNKQRISGKIGLYEMPEILSIQVDSKNDLFLIEQIIKKGKLD